MEQLTTQLNAVILRGVVGSVRTMQHGKQLVSQMSLCTNRAYRDEDGNVVIETTWHRILAVSDDSTVSRDDLQKIEKGSKIAVAGRLHNIRYTTADGEERTCTEIAATGLVYLDDQDAPLEYEYPDRSEPRITLSDQSELRISLPQLMSLHYGSKD